MKRGLCECGCGKPAPIAKESNRSKGHRRGEPMRFRFSHGGNGNRRPDPGYVLDAATGCWNFSGYIRKDGYAGTITAPDGRPRVSAHVAYYERKNGRVAAGFIVDHTCRNPRCVNPDHLEAVSQAENVRRAHARAAFRIHSASRACAAADDAIGAVLRAFRQIAERYGVPGLPHQHEVAAATVLSSLFRSSALVRSTSVEAKFAALQAVPDGAAFISRLESGLSEVAS